MKNRGWQGDHPANDVEARERIIAAAMLAAVGTTAAYAEGTPRTAPTGQNMQNNSGTKAPDEQDTNKRSMAPTAGQTAPGAARTSGSGATNTDSGRASPDEAPHLNVVVTMRGMLLHTFTRVYFEDEAEANERDAVLAAVPADRRGTLIARREPGTANVYRFDIYMQGDRETVFFDL